ncbi:MAG: GNAT family N-acetyltransferase [Ktedonobacterales bacterium]
MAHSSLTSPNIRPFRDTADLEALLALTRDAAAPGTPGVYYRVGDIIWQMFQWPPTVFVAQEHIALWEDASGALLGFLWFDTAFGEVTIQLHPRLRAASDASRRLDALLAWAESLIADAAADDTPQQIVVETLDDDTLLIAAFEPRGYTRGEAHAVLYRRDLPATLPASTLPPGWTIRHVADQAEFEPRVTLHQEVWRPSRVTLEAYRRLRQAPVYRPELDLVAVAPDGALGAYSICWYDAQNRSGEFEPVGTHPNYRQLGLGKAVVLAGCHRLRALGAQTATVGTGKADTLNSTAAARYNLYTSAGFNIVNRAYPYCKAL